MSSAPILSNKAYDRLKWITAILLPALGALYFGLSQIWGIPKGPEVVGSLTLLTTFFGILLGISTKAYNNSDSAHDGVITSNGVDPDTGLPRIALNIHSMPNQLLNKKSVHFNVRPEDPQTSR